MKNIFEIIVGFLVIFVALIFSYFVYQTSDQKLDKKLLGPQGGWSSGRSHFFF